jgi:predicted ATPase
VLARLKTSDPEKWKEIKTELAEFGRECGLFKSVNVKSLGKESDPFQVQITVNGSPTNLIDVGYGVSQVLPLLVDCLEEANQLLLVQQPEVHLHPRAQAQLGSFFGYLVRKHEKQFIVETHSDYLVDRIRMDVRDGKHGLRPEDVSILYFERKDAAVSVHPMQIDGCGNLLNAPPGYRQFFLEEEMKFIGE